ncbi:MAG: hypothetical protein K2X86_12720 [Cytophagaceae bacterium]|nr:hypothetical protein [Cytophagaceae bacterium]
MHQVESYQKQLSALHSADEVDKFFKKIQSEEKNSEVLSSFALQTMKVFQAEQGYLTAYYCYRILSDHCKPEIIGDVKKIREGLPPLPGLRDYRTDYDELLALLENRAKGKCDCTVKTKYNTSPSDALFKIESQQSDQETYSTSYEVICKKCGQKWNVTEDSGYHYPVFGWKKSK